MGNPLDNNPFRQGLRRYFADETLLLLSRARIGIAGAGGLGSNVAVLLARSGIERFFIIDRDIIEPSNLNRQHFWPEHLGQPKVKALGTQLRELNPAIKVAEIHAEITPAFIGDQLRHADIWIEALDDPASKKILVDAAIVQGCPLVAASGIAGCGGAPLGRRKLGHITIVGDFRTGINEAPPLAPRVMQAAAIMADTVLEMLLKPSATQI